MSQYRKSVLQTNFKIIIVPCFYFFFFFSLFPSIYLGLTRSSLVVRSVVSAFCLASSSRIRLHSWIGTEISGTYTSSIIWCDPKISLVIKMSFQNTFHEFSILYIFLPFLDFQNSCAQNWNQYEFNLDANKIKNYRLNSRKLPSIPTFSLSLPDF